MDGVALQRSQSIAGKAMKAALGRILSELNVDEAGFNFTKMVEFTDKKRKNFNVGINGRGRETLSSDQINKIKLIAEPYLEFDMSLIGL